MAPATGRPDVAAWLEAPTASSFLPLLRGRQADDGTPCLNSWGLSMDDAAVLPVLRVLVEGKAELDVELRDYVAASYRKAGLQIEL